MNIYWTNSTAAKEWIFHGSKTIKSFGLFVAGFCSYLSVSDKCPARWQHVKNRLSDNDIAKKAWRHLMVLGLG